MPEQSMSFFVERLAVDAGDPSITNRASTTVVAGAAILLCLSAPSITKPEPSRLIFNVSGTFGSRAADRLPFALAEVKAFSMSEPQEGRLDPADRSAALFAFKAGASLMGCGLAAAAVTFVTDWSGLPVISAMATGVGAFVAANAADRYRKSLG